MKDFLDLHRNYYLHLLLLFMNTYNFERHTQRTRKMKFILQLHHYSKPKNFYFDFILFSTQTSVLVSFVVYGHLQEGRRICIVSGLKYGALRYGLTLRSSLHICCLFEM